MPLTRRRLLSRFVGGGLVIAGAAACDPLGRSEPDARPGRTPAPDPLLELLAAEQALLSQYDAVLARFPAAASVTAVRADHAAHVDALRSVARSPGASPAGSPPPVAVPATLAAAIAALRAAEVSAAARTTAACVAAPAARAALLGSIAACESAHLVILR